MLFLGEEREGRPTIHAINEASPAGIYCWQLDK